MTVFLNCRVERENYTSPLMEDQTEEHYQMQGN